MTLKTPALTDYAARGEDDQAIVDLGMFLTRSSGQRLVNGLGRKQRMTAAACASYDDGRLLQSVIVLGTTSNAPIYFREHHQYTNRHAHIEFDFDDWLGQGSSLPEYPLTDISPPNTDESSTYFWRPALDEQMSMRSMPEGVTFRVGRYVELVEASQPPDFFYHTGLEAHLHKVYRDAEWQAAHNMAR